MARWLVRPAKLVRGAEPAIAGSLVLVVCILVDFRNNSVQIVGPLTKEEKAEWDMWVRRKSELEAELEELKQLLVDKPDYPYREQVEDDIARTRKVIGIIEGVLGGQWS